MTTECQSRAQSEPESRTNQGIQPHLVVETDQAASDSRSQDVTAQAFSGFLEALGLDLADPDLADTPRRVARAYEELFHGLSPEVEPELTTFPNTDGYSSPVSVSGTRFYSLCAHHFLPFFGTVNIGYLPGERIVGLSKLARVVDYCSRRPQTQEGLTEQIVNLLDDRLAPEGVIVVMDARHLCMEMRGVGQPGMTTRTIAVRGAFTQQPLRREFLEQHTSSQS